MTKQRRAHALGEHHCTLQQQPSVVPICTAVENAWLNTLVVYRSVWVATSRRHTRKLCRRFSWAIFLLCTADDGVWTGHQPARRIFFRLVDNARSISAKIRSRCWKTRQYFSNHWVFQAYTSRVENNTPAVIKTKYGKRLVGKILSSP